MEETLVYEGRSLAETPTYLVATVVTVLVFTCLLAQRSIYRCGKWLKTTKRKALCASLEKIKEELMLLGLISLLLAQWARWISEICVDSSLFSSKFYICSEKDYVAHEEFFLKSFSAFQNETDVPHKGLSFETSHHCGEGREPFVSLEGLEQLHRFLFVLGITHVLYSCLAVGLAMSKIYSWRKWENQASVLAVAEMRAKRHRAMQRQSTFVFHHTSHPWSRDRVLLWMLCFLRQFKGSIKRSDYMALRQGFINKHKLPLTYDFHKYMVRSMEDELHGVLGISWPLWGYAILCIFVNIHGINIYFWLSFIPMILVMLVGTKLQHVVSTLALEVVEQTGPSIENQIKPRDDLFWFGKPVILLRLIQFIIFQNAFEMATFIWSLWGLEERSCYLKNHYMIIIRLASGVIVQFWCSYSTVPLNVIITQMGSRFKKALVAESVRDSLHSWCKRVKQRAKRDSMHSQTVRSTCSVESTIDERDEITVASGSLSRSSSVGSLNQVTITTEEPKADDKVTDPPENHELSFRIQEYLNDTLNVSMSQPPPDFCEDENADGKECEEGREEDKVETLFELFKKT